LACIPTRGSSRSRATNAASLTLQEFIPCNIDCTTHAILKHGRPLWSCSFRFEKEGDIRVGVEFKRMAPVEAPAALFEAIKLMLRLLDYSGPCNIDYTIRDSGQIALFEINPRFGGTLFLPENRDRLKQALHCLIRTAIQEPA
jgi:predicted ATP-grasp superfamily ATP-dependent carboligase